MIERKNCTECQKPVNVEIPDGMHDDWKQILRSIGVLCNDCEKLVEKADHERDVFEQRQRDVLAARERLAKSGLPAELRDRTWDALDRDGCEHAITAAREWAAARRSEDGKLIAPGLLLTGPIGVGKTTIAAAAACDYLARRSLRWTSMPLLFARLGAGHNDAQRKAALELMTGRQALVLDDLDKARPTEYGAEQVFAVIDNRITEGAPLLATTNLSLDELAAKFPEPFGDAIASRLAGYCRVLRMQGEDRRLMRSAA